MTNYLAHLILILCYIATGSDVAERATTVDAAADPMAQLQTVTNQLSAKVSQLTAQLTALQNDVSHKDRQISTLTNQVTALQNTVSSKGKQLDSLNVQLQQKGALINNLTHQLNQRGGQLDKLDTYSRSHVSDLITRVGTLETSVTFSVKFGNDSVGNLFDRAGSYQILKFDVIQFQTGGQNYNKTTGLFTAPSSGTYAFFLMMTRNNPFENDCLQAGIIRNANGYVGQVSVCPPGYSASSNLLLTHLNKGDTVHVHTTQSDEIFGYTHTIFTGFKLSPH